MNSSPLKTLTFLIGYFYWSAQRMNESTTNNVDYLVGEKLFKRCSSYRSLDKSINEWLLFAQRRFCLTSGTACPSSSAKTTQGKQHPCINIYFLNRQKKVAVFRTDFSHKSHSRSRRDSFMIPKKVTAGLRTIISSKIRYIYYDQFKPFWKTDLAN